MQTLISNVLQNCSHVEKSSRVEERKARRGRVAQTTYIQTLEMSIFKLEVVYFQLHLKQLLPSPSDLHLSLHSPPHQLPTNHSYQPVHTTVSQHYHNLEFDSLHGLKYHLPPQATHLTLHCQITNPHNKQIIISQDLPIDLKAVLAQFNRDGSSLHENTIEAEEGMYRYMFALLEKDQQSQPERPIQQYIPNSNARHSQRARIVFSVVVLVLLITSFGWLVFGEREEQKAGREKKSSRVRKKARSDL